MNRSPDFGRLTGRISRAIVGLGVIGGGLSGLLGGWTWALGFVLGAAASYFNFRNLAAIVRGLGTTQSAGRLGAFAWILFRFVLLAAGAFVIIRFTQIRPLAVFAGLSVPVAAAILEAIFELTYAR